MPGGLIVKLPMTGGELFGSIKRKALLALNWAPLGFLQPRGAEITVGGPLLSPDAPSSLYRPLIDSSLCSMRS